MTDTKKIELAVSDLAAAVADYAEYRAAKIVNDRMETWHNVMQGLVQKDAELAQRVQKLENAGSPVTNLELNALDVQRKEMDEKLHAAHRRIADLEIRIEDMEKGGREVSDLEERIEELEREVDAKHRLIEKLEERADDLERDVRNTADTARSTVADMINDGEMFITII